MAYSAAVDVEADGSSAMSSGENTAAALGTETAGAAAAGMNDEGVTLAAAQVGGAIAGALSSPYL